MQEKNYFDLPKAKEQVVKALESLLKKLDEDDSEEPMMVVQKCADAHFAPLPTHYQGVLDKMLAKGSNKKVLGAAQNTFAWDANTKEFVQCVPYSTFRLAQQLEEKDATSTKNVVQRALKTLLNFEKVWKKQTAQLSAITAPNNLNNSADYYIDDKGNVVNVRMRWEVQTAVVTQLKLPSKVRNGHDGGAVRSPPRPDHQRHGRVLVDALLEPLGRACLLPRQKETNGSCWKRKTHVATCAIQFPSPSHGQGGRICPGRRQTVGHDKLRSRDQENGPYHGERFWKASRYDQ